MPKFCILPEQAEKLKQAFKSGEISMTKLFSVGSSAGRIEMLSEYVGEGAKMAVAKIEKAYLAPNQKLAMRNAIFQLFGEKPLYKGLTLDDANKFSRLDIADLKKMSSEQRINTLARTVDKDLATKLNDRFEKLSKTANLKLWEEKTMGTETLRTNAKLKGSLAKLEALDDLGILNPKQVEDFMQTFVETKVGADITFEESKKLSELINKQRVIFDRIEKSGDWTGDNFKDNLDYRLAIEELNKYVTKIKKEQSAVEFGNDLITIWRNNILGAVTSFTNSALYQAIPTIERSITKRLSPATLLMEGTILEKISVKLSVGLFVGKKGRKLIFNQLKLGLAIYDKTSMDISRATTLNDGYSFFGEKERRGAIPITTFLKSLKKDIIIPFLKAKGIKAKISEGISGVVEITSLFPKWMAGGTDTTIATISRAGTTVLWSNQIARLEKITNKLPEGISEEARAIQLFKDSYSPNTTDPKAQMVREQGILDAHFSNNTQPDGMADWAIKARDALGFKGIKFGKAIIPFLKITTATLSRGLQTAIPVGVVKNIYKLNRAFKNINEEGGVARANKAISALAGFIGLSALTILIATLLDDDDYIPPYAALTFKEFELAKARGARPSSIRIGGKWIPIRFLPMISIPISSIMMARQAKARGGDYKDIIWGYGAGILTQILDTPIISEVYKLIKKMDKAVSKKDLDDVSDVTGLNMEDIWNWSKIRMMPAMISRDLYNAFFSTTKYNFLGQEVEKGRVFRDDKTNVITLEFEELNKDGEMPAISNPTGDYAKELEAKMGKEKYESFLAELQRDYVEEVYKLMERSGWDDKTPAQKKKAIDKKRTSKILDKLKKENKDFE